MPAQAPEDTVTREPPMDTDASTRDSDAEGLTRLSQVGRYLVLRLLGRGGMGVVYAAYDPDLDRKVALKILRPDTRTDPELARARLLREAQAMARVSHPNVIPVFDVGIWGDQVFVAMELVDGHMLSDWLREARRSWQEVLEVFLGAGRGLQGAHDAGLVHRDFKPGNVLVSRAGRVFVTDFGLARQVGAASPDEAPTEVDGSPLSPERRMLEVDLTAAGLVVGTPSFMSPEQFRGGDVDARSDQFSFCVSLYSALYGKRPFDPERLRRAMSPDVTAPVGEAQRPRSPWVGLIEEPPRDARVPAWVRQAVMRGLSVEPSDRFPSMKELLDALSQEQRLTRRRRWAAAAGALGVGLLLIGAVAYRQSQVCAGAGQLMDEVWSPVARQRMDAVFQATGRPFARDVAGRVRQVLDAYADAWVRQRTEACEATRVRSVQTEDLLSRRVACLERRRRDLRALVTYLTEADAAAVEKAVDAAHALPALDECADLESLAEQQRLPADPAARAEIERLGGLLGEVKTLVSAGRFQAAEEKARQLEGPVAATGYLPLVAELRLHRAWIQQQTGHPNEAAAGLRQAAYDAESGRADRLKVTILTRLLFVEGERSQFDRAEDASGSAEASLRRIGGDPVLESDVLVNRANLAISRGRFQDARELLEQAQARQQRALPPGHPKRARVTFLLGRTLVSLGERTRGVAVLEEALAQTEAAVGALHPDVARRHGALSWALREMGDYARALDHARATADISKALFGPADPAWADALDEVGMCQLGLGRHADALQTYRASLEVKLKALPPDADSLQFTYDGVGQALLGLGRASEAVAPLEKAVSFTAVEPAVLAESGFALARALWEAGQPDPARAEAARARERFSQAQQATRAAEVLAWLESHGQRSRAHGPRGATGKEW